MANTNDNKPTPLDALLGTTTRINPSFYEAGPVIGSPGVMQIQVVYCRKTTGVLTYDPIYGSFTSFFMNSDEVKTIRDALVVKEEINKENNNG